MNKDAHGFIGGGITKVTPHLLANSAGELMDLRGIKDKRVCRLETMDAPNVLDHAARNRWGVAALAANLANVDAIPAGPTSPPPQLRDAPEWHEVLPPRASL
jgi:hypothetical protein